MDEARFATWKECEDSAFGCRSLSFKKMATNFKCKLRKREPLISNEEDIQR